MQNVKSDEVALASELKRESSPAVLFPLTPEQARVTAFPPGCDVLHVNDEDSPPTVTLGQVESVSFDVASKELLYAVVPKNDPITSNSQSSIVASETQLLFAPLCTVEATLNGSLGPTTKPAIVLTSYQPCPLAEPLYSLQEEDSGALLHGLPKACVKYRPVESREQTEQEVSSEGTVQETETAADASRNEPHEETPSETVAVDEVPKNEPPPNEPDEHEEPPPPPPHQGVTPSPVVHHRRGVGRRPSIPGRGVKRPNQLPGAKSHSNSTAPTDPGHAPKRARLERDSTLLESAAAEKSAMEDHTNDNVDESATKTKPRALNFAPATSTQDTNLGSDTHTVLEDGEERDEIVEKIFNIPGNVFSIDETKEFFRANTHRLMHETNCILRLKSRDRHYGEELYVDIQGPRKLLDSAICTLEKSLISLAHPFEQGRAAFYMAILNDHRFVTERNGFEIVYQNCYHHSKYGQKIPQYILYKRFPEGFRPAFGMAIGSRGRFKNKIAKDTNCTIETNPDSSSPHYVIYGHDVENVARCGQQFQKSLDDAVAFKKREKQQLRRYSR